MDHCTWEMIQTSFFPQPEKDKPIKIIQIAPPGLQPRKMEEIITDKRIPEDTYIIYPDGGYHPFYGVPNTFPRYQLPIWPRVVRIKFKQPRSRGRSRDLSQLNCDFRHGYPRISFGLGTRDINGLWEVWDTQMHRLIALTFVPNPEGKKNVMHINDDKTNYLLENLTWGTSGENNKGRMCKRPDTTEDKYNHMVREGIIKG